MAHLINWAVLMCLTETEVANTVPVVVCTRFSAYMLWQLDCCFGWIPNSGNRCVSDFFFACSRGFLSSIGLPYPAWIWGILHCLIWHVWLLSLGSLLFSGVSQKDSGLWKRDGLDICKERREGQQLSRCTIWDNTF